MSKHFKTIPHDRKQYRIKKQKYKSTRDVKFLEEITIEKPRKKEEVSTKTFISKAILKQSEQTLVANKNLSVEMDIPTFLLFLRTMLENEKITKEDILNFLNKAVKSTDGFDIKDDKNPEYTFHVTTKTTKDELRDHWILLMQRGHLFCDICGKHIDTLKGPKRLTYDHIVPKSKGGRTDGLNGSPAHSICNGLKGNMLPEEWEIYGYDILRSRGIEIDPIHSMYVYRQMFRCR